MSQKVDQQRDSQLLQARRDALEQLKFGSMRSHGKLWGMDVFSWPNPEMDLLATTIHSFPFPVIWIGAAKGMLECLDRHPEIGVNLKSAVAYDEPGWPLKTDKVVAIPEAAGTESAEDALALGTILLFTADGSEWERNLMAFNQFLELHQIH